MIRVRWLIALVLLQAAPAAATTFTVTSTNDSGPGSLRECIQVVNANPPGPHRIVFNIPGAGMQTIHLLSDLDAITTTTTIDGTTQPGYNANAGPLIELDGTQATGRVLALSAPHSSLRGFVVNRYPSTGIVVDGTFCSVSACFIGTDYTGTTGQTPLSSFGVLVTGDDAMIGGRIPADRNIVSGNGFMGIALNTAARDTVMNNFIGTDVTGTAAVPNTDYGLEAGNTTKTVIDQNLVSGNTGYGIYVDSSVPPGPTDGSRVTRNLVGTDASGAHALPNLSIGVELASAYTILGDVGRGNVISGNGDYGVSAGNGFYPSHDQILGNKIGVTADGTRPLGNVSGGIYVSQAVGTIIGVSRGDGSGNIIAANGGAGIEIADTNSVDTSIQGNAIGTSFNGALALGNTGSGITSKGNHVTIGGSGLAGNVIANNDGGVSIGGGVRSAIEGNAIFENVPGIGIDLVKNAGVTPNDSLDLDDGPNRLQNFPVITDATVPFAGQVQIIGTLASFPNHQFTIDFYSNRTCSAKGYGEGESWAGQLVATTDETGHVGFVTIIPLSTLVGYVFTATATDDVGNTSEFSLCKSLTEPTAANAVAPGFGFAAPRPSPARQSTDLTFSLAEPSHVSLRAYDVSGREVANILQGAFDAGPHTVPWDVEGVRAGVYFCRLSAQDANRTETATRAVIVVR